MAEYFDISNWHEKPWFQTGGTRNKMVVENPVTHKVYFFKTSLKKEKKDYKYEFWSEIIASEIGKLYGFDMLQYDIAFTGEEIGCISESMVTEGVNKLTEGISYLTGYETTYNPKLKESKKQYTFQFICEALKVFNLNKYIENIIEIIIFDSIVGNGDRHQENWGIITKYNDIIKEFKEHIEKPPKSNIEKYMIKVFKFLTSHFNKKFNSNWDEVLPLLMPGKFSQIYDSGSCLGRELSDEKINQIISDSGMMSAYIERGVSEIHWNGEKLNHFDLIKNIQKEHSEIVERVIQKVRERSKESEIRRIVENIDKNLPPELERFKLPKERKEFIIKLVSLRTRKLITLL